jgi:hypothetical protein
MCRVTSRCTLRLVVLHVPLYVSQILLMRGWENLTDVREPTGVRYDSDRRKTTMSTGLLLIFLRSQGTRRTLFLVGGMIIMKVKERDM